MYPVRRRAFLPVPRVFFPDQTSGRLIFMRVVSFCFVWMSTRGAGRAAARVCWTRHRVCVVVLPLLSLLSSVEDPPPAAVAVVFEQVVRCGAVTFWVPTLLCLCIFYTPPRRCSALQFIFVSPTFVSRCGQKGVRLEWVNRSPWCCPTSEAKRDRGYLELPTALIATPLL